MPVDFEYRRRLNKLGSRLSEMPDALNTEGVLHGAKREAAIDRKLQDLGRDAATTQGRRGMSEVATDLEILKLSFERFLARLDKDF